MEGLLPIAALHLLACLSPGPDILLVARTRLSEGRSAALATVAGILLGVTLHVALGLTGLSFLMAKGDAFVAFLSLAGGAWLIYMGIAGWPKGRPSPDRTAVIAPATLQRCFQRGLIVNLLNPKAFLYFVSLFSTLLGPELDPSHRALAASSLILVQFGAFSLVAVLLPEPSSAPQWAALQRLAQVLISLLFIGIGIWIWGTALIDRLI
jgi:threonine efflux protein